MVGTLREERRRGRVNAIKAFINKSLRDNGELNYSKLIARFVVDLPASRRTVKEYVDTILELREDLVMEEGIIMPKPDVLLKDEQEVLDAAIK